MSELEDQLFHLKLVLDETVKFPTEYYFKFIVPAGEIDKMLNILNGAKIEKKPSSAGKYISVSGKKIVKSSDEVISVYQKAATIKGVISL